MIPLPALLGTLLPRVQAAAPRLAGDKDQAEANTHAEQAAVFRQFAAEFRDFQKRTWWDSFVDGLNRLPRPLMVFAVLGMFGYAGTDPLGFSAVMTALQLVPEWLAIVSGQIILLFFGGRVVENLTFKGSASVETVKSVMQTISELGTLKTQRDAPAGAPAHNADATHGGTPAAATGNPAIAERARRRDIHNDHLR